jgi:hypothetical protein
MIYLTQSQYARLHRVSKVRVFQWIKNNRIPVYKMNERVVLIDKRTPRPEPIKSGRPTNFSKSLNCVKDIL